MHFQDTNIHLTCIVIIGEKWEMLWDFMVNGQWLRFIRDFNIPVYYMIESILEIRLWILNCFGSKTKIMRIVLSPHAWMRPSTLRWKLQILEEIST